MTDSSSNFILRLGCGFILVLVIITIACSIFTLVNAAIPHYPRKELFVADMSNPTDTAEAFVYSLPFNRMDDMKSYVAEEKWGFLDRWAIDHEPISEECHFLDEAEFSGSWIVSSSRSAGQYSAGIFYFYQCPQYLYNFHASIELELTNSQWQIVGWKDLCERKSETTEVCWND